MSFSIIYITHAGEKEAKTLSDLLLHKKVIACANLFPITSAYWWQGTIEHEGEWVSIVKTTNKKWKVVEQLVLEHHPYEVPCILRMEVSANDSYEKWISDSIEN